MPITAARRMCSPTTVRPIPSDREITRALTPHAYFRHRTSRTFRIDNLSAGIGPSPLRESQREDLARSDCRQRSPTHPVNRWPPSIGIGGRFPSDWVTAFRRNHWPPCLGIRKCNAGKAVQGGKQRSGIGASDVLDRYPAGFAQRAAFLHAVSGAALVRKDRRKCPLIRVDRIAIAGKNLTKRA
jgi:hypothetical protein